MDTLNRVVCNDAFMLCPTRLLQGALDFKLGATTDETHQRLQYLLTSQAGVFPAAGALLRIECCVFPYVSGGRRPTYHTLKTMLGPDAPRWRYIIGPSTCKAIVEELDKIKCTSKRGDNPGSIQCESVSKASAVVTKRPRPRGVDNLECHEAPPNGDCSVAPKRPKVKEGGSLCTAPPNVKDSLCRSAPPNVKDSLCRSAPPKVDPDEELPKRKGLDCTAETSSVPAHEKVKRPRSRDATPKKQKGKCKMPKKQKGKGKNNARDCLATLNGKDCTTLKSLEETLAKLREQMNMLSRTTH